ncbi:sugar ABC transporter ATP-binding protein [candidate division KSB1 bacterium]|nr:sugar ABC transporter ATP-binding protein [candidate division KSB1 bacterium]
MKTVVEFVNISKSFFAIRALSNVSFSLSQGHVLGLVGENGAGKSTLMNILGGNLLADNGQIILRGECYTPKSPADAAVAGIAFIHQELNLFTNLSIADNLFIDRFPKKQLVPFIDKKAIEINTKQALSALKLSVSPYEIVEKLQPGERQMVEVARALSTGADIFIFDEPTTSLTSRETEHLFEIIRKLKFSGKSIIYISHILEDVQRLCDDIVILRDGSVVATGPIKDFDVPGIITSMCGCQLDQLFPDRLSQPREDIVLRLRNVSKAGVVKNINLTLFKGEVLGLFGLMGSGRSELVRLIFGLDSFEDGEIFVCDSKLKTFSPQSSIRHRIAFVTEKRREEGLLLDASIRENIGLVAFSNSRGALSFLDSRKMDAEIAESVTALCIKMDSPNALVKNLSGGNQQKVVIGKWLLSKPDIFIMDEPTRGIDVGARFEIYSIINDLAAQGAGILLISSELEELLGICDRILVMSNGEINAEFDKGQFNDHLILQAAFGETVDKEPNLKNSFTQRHEATKTVFIGLVECLQNA